MWKSSQLNLWFKTMENDCLKVELEEITMWEHDQEVKSISQFQIERTDWQIEEMVTPVRGEWIWACTEMPGSWSWSKRDCLGTVVGDLDGDPRLDPECRTTKAKFWPRQRTWLGFHITTAVSVMGSEMQVGPLHLQHLGFVVCVTTSRN